MFVERRVISGNQITWKSKATSFVSRTDIVGIGISRLTRISTWGSAPGFLSLWGFRRKHGTRSLEPLVTYDCLGRTPGSTERGFSGLTVDLRLFCENRPWPPRKSPGETLLSTPPHSAVAVAGIPRVATDRATSTSVCTWTPTKSV